MRILSVAAAMALALVPALAPAQSSTGQAAQPAAKPAAGPLAGRPISQSEVPPAVIVTGGLVLVGALLVGVLGSTDSNNNTNKATTQ